LTSLYERLISLISADYPDKWPVLKQKHESQQVILAAGGKDTWSFVPPTGTIFLVYSTTMGWARDSSTDADINPTTSVGFKHWQEPNVLEHYNYMLRSIVNFPEESYIEVEEGSPLQIAYFNDLDDTGVYFDVTIWYFEITVKDWEFVRDYIRKTAFANSEGKTS